MASSKMTFSAILEVATAAFNKGVNDAANNYNKATTDIINQSKKLGQSTEEVANELSKVLKAPNAKELTTALADAARELDKTKQGASLTADELRRIGAAGKQATAELTGELKTAQSELTKLRTTKAAPEDIDKAEQKVKELKVAVSDLGASYGKFQSSASAAARRAAADTQDAAEKAKAAGKAIYDTLNIRTNGQLQTEIAQITAQLKSFKANAGAPAEEVQRVTNAATERIKQLRAELSGVQPSANSAAAGIKEIAGQVAGLAGITVGLAGIKQGIESVLQATIQFQAINKQLEYATGNAAAAGKEFDFIRQVTKDLGLELFSSAEGYAKLAAATKGTRLEGEGTRTLFLGIASAAASMNLSVEDTNGVILALSQIAGKGKVSMEELRGQLGERLTPAMKIAADSIGVTTSELNDMVEAGIDSTSFLEKFGPALVKAFSGTAASNLNTLNGQLSQLMNRFTELKLQLGTGENGLGAAASVVIGDLVGLIDKFSEALQKVDPRTVTAVREAFSQLYDIVKNVFSTLIQAAGDAYGAINDVFNAVTAAVAGFYGFETAGEQVDLLTSTLQGLSILLGTLNDGVKAIGIAFTVVTGVVESFFSAIAFGLSKVTFGDLSKQLEDFAFKLQDSAQASFSKANTAALNFTSSTVAALDKVAQAGVDSAKKGSDAAVAGHATSTAAATTAAGTQQAAAQATANAQVQASGQAAAAAVSSMQTVALASLQGEVATVKVADATKAVAAAFRELANDAGITLPITAKNAADLARVMAEVAVASSSAAAAIGRELPDAVAKLNPQQLVVFTQAFVQGLKDAGASAEYVAQTVQTLATATVKALGGDIAPALTTVTKGFTDQKAALDSLIANYSALGKSGVDAGQAIVISLQAIADKTRNPTELLQLIQYWKDLGAQGKITGQQMIEGIDAVKEKIDGLKPGINSLAEAFKTLGLQSREEAQKIAAQYLDAFNKIQYSGQASALQLQTAFQKYAQAATDANGGVVDSMTKVKAEALGLSVQADATGRVIVSAMGSAAQATAGLTTATSSAQAGFVALGQTVQSVAAGINGSVGNITASLSKLKDNLDADGFVKDSSGNRLTLTNQLKIPEGYYFDQAAAQKDPRFVKGLIDGSQYVKPTPEKQAELDQQYRDSINNNKAKNPNNMYGNAGKSVFGDAAYKSPPPPPPPAPPPPPPAPFVGPPTPTPAPPPRNFWDYIMNGALVGPTSGISVPSPGTTEPDVNGGRVTLEFVGPDGSKASATTTSNGAQAIIDTLKKAGASATVKR